MKKLIIVFSIISFNSLYAQVFTLVDSIQYSQAQIWGVVSDDGDSLASTTTFTPGTKPHIYLRKGDYTDINQQGIPNQLTFDADFVGFSNMTDHKSIVLNNEFYVTYSTQGDSDLFIFKTDINGNRIGSLVSVVQNQTDPTNDMILVTDSTYIYVLHFDPPFQHHVYKFDTNLNPVGSPFSTTTLAHNNIGNVLIHNNEFYMLTGDFFGFNADLVLTRWDINWTPTIGSPQTVVDAVGGDGNWFSTGMIWDEINQRWYVGMSHINPTDVMNQEHIDLLAFDINFNLLQRMHITGQGYYRPHFVLKNNYLYVSYDQPGSGVYLLKYQVANTVGLENDEENEMLVFPNPVHDFVNVVTSDEIILTDVSGRILDRIAKSEDQMTKLDMREYPTGIYFVKTLSTTTKILKE